MTLGQRIAQKRKELGLSQEGLGEQLGVSRQAIYKWESDASLPEIDKLITLSRIFSVSVGWLLGLEADGPKPIDPDQERLMEDILSRYQAAQPESRKSVWDKWSVRFLFALCGIMLALLAGTNSRVKEMEQQYDNLRWAIDDLTISTDNQVDAAIRRMEESLQNDLMVDWSAEPVFTDRQANTVTFQIRAVPKTYTEGMTALFIAYNGSETVELPAELGAGHSFSGRLTCPLSDKISLSVLFLSNGTGEAQHLKDCFDLYYESFPELSVNTVWYSGSDRNVLLPTGRDSAVTVWEGDEICTPEPPAKLQVGLFRDQKLVLWYEPGVRYLDAVGREVPGWNLPERVELEDGYVYCVAALYTDESGRQRIYSGASTVRDSSPASAASASMTPGRGEDPAGWEF